MPGKSRLVAIAAIGRVTIRHSSVVHTAIRKALSSPRRYSGSRRTPVPSAKKKSSVNFPSPPKNPPRTVSTIGQIRNIRRMPRIPA